MVDWNDASRGALDKGFGAVQERAKQAGREQREKKEKPPKQPGDKPLLTHIAQEAGMGGLMYEVPSSKLLSSIRSAEQTIYKAFKKKGVSVEASETPKAPEAEKTVAEKVFMNFCKTHREGHMEGLRKIPQTELLSAILTNAEAQPNMDAKDLAAQAAVTLEAAGDDENTKGELRRMLGESSVWKSRVVDTQATNGMQIAGISEVDNALFPGAARFEIPAKEPTDLDSKLNGLFEKWKGFVAASTEKRTRNFVEKNKPVSVATEIGKVVEAI